MLFVSQKVYGVYNSYMAYIIVLCENAYVSRKVYGVHNSFGFSNNNNNPNFLCFLDNNDSYFFCSSQGKWAYEIFYIILFVSRKVHGTYRIFLMAYHTDRRHHI